MQMPFGGPPPAEQKKQLLKDAAKQARRFPGLWRLLPSRAVDYPESADLLGVMLKRFNAATLVAGVVTTGLFAGFFLNTPDLDAEHEAMLLEKGRQERAKARERVRARENGEPRPPNRDFAE
eukprot:CAMPEP_0205825960 /NCGR_PEP_ID=MMETSP0206-20130828/27015_1 /ASSEMBLY_ACC=CAM_ASM_000279 /TAXON_ID=36767 /ORGANISM="Euplotes focardii, Strain TN1" /LENGTH=121 /DNA_ID=CAMNT_0053125433 /DNA_START=42 /DNA_END=406 /DNA_ORIENTATION=+